MQLQDRNCTARASGQRAVTHLHQGHVVSSCFQFARPGVCHSLPTLSFVIVSMNFVQIKTVPAIDSIAVPCFSLQSSISLSSQLYRVEFLIGFTFFFFFPCWELRIAWKTIHIPNTWLCHWATSSLVENKLGVIWFLFFSPSWFYLCLLYEKKNVTCFQLHWVMFLSSWNFFLHLLFWHRRSSDNWRESVLSFHRVGWEIELGSSGSVANAPSGSTAAST